MAPTKKNNNQITNHTNTSEILNDSNNNVGIFSPTKPTLEDVMVAVAQLAKSISAISTSTAINLDATYAKMEKRFREISDNIKSLATVKEGIEDGWIKENMTSISKRQSEIYQDILDKINDINTKLNSDDLDIYEDIYKELNIISTTVSSFPTMLDGIKASIELSNQTILNQLDNLYGYMNNQLRGDHYIINRDLNKILNSNEDCESYQQDLIKAGIVDKNGHIINAEALKRLSIEAHQRIEQAKKKLRETDGFKSLKNIAEDLSAGTDTATYESSHMFKLKNTEIIRKAIPIGLAITQIALTAVLIHSKKKG